MLSYYRKTYWRGGFECEVELYYRRIVLKSRFCMKLFKYCWSIVQKKRGFFLKRYEVFLWRCFFMKRFYEEVLTKRFFLKRYEVFAWNFVWRGFVWSFCTNFCMKRFCMKFWMKRFNEEVFLWRGMKILYEFLLVTF